MALSSSTSSKGRSCNSTDASRSTICGDCSKELAWKTRPAAATTRRCIKDGESQSSEKESCTRSKTRFPGQGVRPCRQGTEGRARGARRRSSTRARLDLARNRRVAGQGENDRQVPRARLPRARDDRSRARSSREEDGDRHRKRIPAGIRDDSREGKNGGGAEIRGP